MPRPSKPLCRLSLHLGGTAGAAAIMKARNGLVVAKSNQAVDSASYANLTVAIMVLNELITDRECALELKTQRTAQL